MTCNCFTDCIADCNFCNILDLMCFWDTCSDHGCSYQPSYDDKTAENTINTANELAEMQERANREGKKMGDAAFQEINGYIKKFLKQMEEINNNEYAGKRLNIDMDAINREVNTMKNAVKGFIGEKINERLVMTDAELAAILEEQDEKKRKRRFDDFYSQLHKDALRKLIDYIQDTIDGEYNMIATQIRTRLKEVENTMQEASQSYEEMKRLKAAGDKDLAAKQVEAMYRITLADIMLEELSSV